MSSPADDEEAIVRAVVCAAKQIAQRRRRRGAVPIVVNRTAADAVVAAHANAVARYRLHRGGRDLRIEDREGAERIALAAQLIRPAGSPPM